MFFLLHHDLAIGNPECGRELSWMGNVATREIVTITKEVVPWFGTETQSEIQLFKLFFLLHHDLAIGNPECGRELSWMGNVATREIVTITKEVVLWFGTETQSEIQLFKFFNNSTS